MNPMIGKELRQRMRERRGWVLPSLYLLTLGAVISFAYYVTTANSYRELQGWEIGVSLFLTSAYTQLAILLLLAPIFSAGALTIEKEQRTLSGLLTSLLGPVRIWWGKFVASLLYVLLLLVAGLPILSAVFAFGGVGPWEVAMAAFTTVVILGTISAVSLYFSSAFRRSVHATAVSYVAVIVLTLVTFIVFLIAVSTRHGQSSTWQAMPAAVKAPLYLNPVFFLTMAFAPIGDLYPEWVTCLGVFLLLGALSILMTLRNLRRSGEAV
jgi:ABC-2 type transport system permease protein